MTDQILSPEEITRRLQGRTISVVAREVGLHHTTVYAIAKGDSDSSHVRWETVRALSEYLTRDDVETASERERRADRGDGSE